MKFTQSLAARLAVTLACLTVAILVSVAMFTAFPANYPWINLIPGGIIWVIVTPAMERCVARLCQRKMD